MTETKYTFLLPAYKARYLEDMLESISKQTYHNFKVIISDDCSPEQLYDVCKRFLSDERFTYRRNEYNIGGSNLIKHWNQLVDICETEFLILASDDDVYAPDFLMEIDSLQNKYPNVDLFRSRVKRIDQNGVITAQDYPSDEYESQVDFLYGLFCLRRLKCIANYVFRTSKLKEVGCFEDFPLAWGSDDITVMKVSANGVCITPRILFSFRLSGINITTTSNNQTLEKRVMARMQNLVFFDNFIKIIKVDNTPLQIQRFNDFKKFYETVWTSNIIEGSCFASYDIFKQILFFLSNRNAFHGILHKIHIVWTWVRAYKTRK